jgi:hypothetical protein
MDEDLNVFRILKLVQAGSVEDFSSSEKPIMVWEIFMNDFCE